MSHRLWPSAITTLLLVLGTGAARAEEHRQQTPELLPPPKCCSASEDCCAQVKGAEAHSGIAPCCAKRASTACSEEEMAVAACIGTTLGYDAVLMAMAIDCGPGWYWLRQQSDGPDGCCASHASTGSCCVSPARAKSRGKMGQYAPACPGEGAVCSPVMPYYAAPPMMIGTGPCVPASPVCMPVFPSPPMPPAGPWPMSVAMPAPPMPCPVPAPAIIRPWLTIRA